MTPRIGITCSTLTTEALANLRHAANGTYVEWVVRSGGLPVLLPNVSPDLAPAALAGLDGLLASGGDDVHPLCYGTEPAKRLGDIDVLRDRFELPLLRLALAAGLPLLGICRGIQSLNVAAGGDLRQDLVYDPEATVQHRMSARGAATVHHSVDLAPGSRLRELLGRDRVAVNSYHHQAVGRLGDGLEVAATAPDGTIEAVEGADRGRFLLGLQWHPEMMPPGDVVSTAVFEGFLKAAHGYASNRSARLGS